MPGGWREQQRDGETVTAAGVVVGRTACRFTTSHRSAKVAIVMRCRTSSRSAKVVTTRNTGGSGGRRVERLHYPAASNPREIPQPRPRFSRSVLKSAPRDDDAPLIG
jgi:hypothetical protein